MSEGIDPIAFAAYTIRSRFMGEVEKVRRDVQSTQKVVEAAKEEDDSLLDVSGMIGECTHQGHYRVIGGNCIALRWCTNCGKSWRMPTQGDYIFGDHPVAEWEPIKEGLEVEQRVLPDYEE